MIATARVNPSTGAYASSGPDAEAVGVAESFARFAAYAASAAARAGDAGSADARALAEALVNLVGAASTPIALRLALVALDSFATESAGLAALLAVSLGVALQSGSRSPLRLMLTTTPGHAPSSLSLAHDRFRTRSQPSWPSRRACTPRRTLPRLAPRRRLRAGPPSNRLRAQSRRASCRWASSLACACVCCPFTTAHAQPPRSPRPVPHSA
jgi:hypothetical protein